MRGRQFYKFMTKTLDQVKPLSPILPDCKPMVCKWVYDYRSWKFDKTVCGWLARKHNQPDGFIANSLWRILS